MLNLFYVLAWILVLGENWSPRKNSACEIQLFSSSVYLYIYTKILAMVKMYSVFFYPCVTEK